MNDVILTSISNEAEILLWAFEHSSDGMLVTDLDGRVVKINDAFVRMFGYDRSEIIGNRTSVLKSRSSTLNFYQEMWLSLNGTGEWKGEITNTRKNGEEVICFLTITSIVSDKGEKLGYLGVEIDLTDRKRLEAHINRNLQLSSIGEALTSLAHEIRNPLNGIKMNAYLLEKACHQQGVEDEEVKESLQLITKETKRLQSMVESVLSFARGQKLHPERVLVQELVDDIVKLTTQNADELNVSIKTHIEPELTVLCDIAQMKQVILNVLQNAVEASSVSDSKQVFVEIAKRQYEGEGAVSISGNAVVIDVYDSGLGMSTETRLSLFTPFFTTKQTGLGLGLATSQKIVREHHGEMTVESPLRNLREPFRTKFTIALPV
jgi:two-component system sporulation sensor kinase A